MWCVLCVKLTSEAGFLRNETYRGISTKGKVFIVFSIEAPTCISGGLITYNYFCNVIRVIRLELCSWYFSVTIINEVDIASIQCI